MLRKSWGEKFAPPTPTLFGAQIVLSQTKRERAIALDIEPRMKDARVV